MQTFWLFLILGSATGALYALGALGLVLTYRGSGTVNFATGAIGLVGAYVFWELEGVHVPVLLALVLGVVSSGGLGLVTYLMMRRLRSESHLARVVLTIVILATIEGALGLKYPLSNSYLVKPFFPTGPVSVLGAHVGRDRLLLIAAAAVMTAVVFVAYRYTRFGLATAAVAENPESAVVAGWSVERIASSNWVLGAALSGLGTILLVPIVGLSDSLGTSLLLPILAAAVIGNLTSFPLTLAGGLAIGIAQAEMQRYVHVSGLGDSIPFIAIIVIIVLRGRNLPLRSYVGERLPRVTSGRINWAAVIGAVVITAFLIEWVLPLPWVNAAISSLAVVLPVASLVVLTGFAGQISLAQWAISGLGAMVLARLVMAGVGFEVSILLTLVLAVPMGLILGAASLRARGMSLAIATLAFGSAVISLVLANTNLNGQDAGLTLGTFHLFGVNLDSTVHPQRFALFSLILVAIILIGVINIRRGGVGRRLLAVRSNERAAVSLGISVFGSKLAAFCYSSVMAAAGGILVATRFSTVVFNLFDSLTSVQMVSQAVLGGVGYATGPILGSQGNPGTISDRAVENIGGISAYQYLIVGMGLLTIQILMTSPDGLVPLNVEMVKTFARRLLRRPVPERSQELAVVAEVVPKESGDDRVQVQDLTIRLGGVVALRDVSLSLQSGEVLGIIGPNGAGKTTLIDAISGFVQPAAGSVLLNDLRLGSMSPRRRAARGIGRSFQSLELFEDLTVYENLVTACDQWNVRRWFVDLVKPARPVVNEAGAAAARDFGLASAELLAKYPRELSYGSRRLLAIARVVASGPRVLLLDEPAAGLDDDERRELARLIRRLASEQRMAILLVEHDIDLVCSVSDRVLALDHGEVISEGAPAQVRSDHRVVTSYLGEDASGELGTKVAPQVPQFSEK